MLFRVCWTYENGEILVGSGSKHSDWLDIFAILQLSTPALDEENKIDESDYDEISAKPKALNTLCGLVCVPQGAKHLLEVPFDLIHDLDPDLEVRNPKYVHCERKRILVKRGSNFVDCSSRIQTLERL